MSGALRRICAINYRCLRKVDVELDQFHVFVGANGTGKSALFDVLLFTRDLLESGLDSAVDERTSDFRDLVWGRPNRNLRFKFVFELDVPDTIKERIPESCDRFTVSIAVQEMKKGLSATLDASLERRDGGGKSIGSVLRDRWKTRIKFDSTSSFEAAVEFENPFVSRHIERTFSRIQEVALEGRLLRQASLSRWRRQMPTSTSFSRALPWLVHRLQRYPTRFRNWKKHIRTVITDLRDVRVDIREDNRHSYLTAIYRDGLEVPSWSLSDGTLRLLALTIIAYLPEYGRSYLIEEPENGIHPLAIEAIYRSLSSAYSSQVLIATHSPVLLACTEPKELLCFSKRGGETQIIRGDQHPRLAHWQSAADVDLLFASDVLA